MTSATVRNSTAVRDSTAVGDSIAPKHEHGPGGPTASRTPYHHGDLEHALVAEALTQVSVRGADGVSLRQVAQAVGVSPSAAYAHFPDKNALMSVVAEEAMAVFDARMVAAASSAIPEGTAGNRLAVERFWRTGEAYVRFALEEPHLFRHVFSPYCSHGSVEPDAEKLVVDPAGLKQDSVSYALLCTGLDDLDRRGLLRPGVRDGLDVLVWTTVHGFACLVLDGGIPLAWQDNLLRSISQLVLVESAQVEL